MCIVVAFIVLIIVGINLRIVCEIGLGIVLDILVRIVEISIRNSSK